MTTYDLLLSNAVELRACFVKKTNSLEMGRGFEAAQVGQMATESKEVAMRCQALPTCVGPAAREAKGRTGPSPHGASLLPDEENTGTRQPGLHRETLSQISNKPKSERNQFQALLFWLGGHGEVAAFLYLVLHTLVLHCPDQKPLLPLSPVLLCQLQRSNSRVQRSVRNLSLGRDQMPKSQQLSWPLHP